MTFLTFTLSSDLVHLTTLSVAQNLQQRNLGLLGLTINELEMRRKEVVMAQFKILSSLLQREKSPFRIASICTDI